MPYPQEPIRDTRDLVVTPDGTLEITTLGEVTIGRDPSSDVVLGHPSASRAHARLVRESGVWRLLDLSPTGILLDGRRVSDILLEPGVTRVEMPPGGAPVEFRLGQESIAGQPGVGSDLPPDRVMTIGRSPENDIVLDDPSVSRVHAEVRMSGPGAEIVDLGSFNGTFVNAFPIRRMALTDGDLIDVGNRTLRYENGRLEEYDEG